MIEFSPQIEAENAKIETLSNTVSTAEHFSGLFLLSQDLQTIHPDKSSYAYVDFLGRMGRYWAKRADYEIEKEERAEKGETIDSFQYSGYKNNIPVHDARLRLRLLSTIDSLKIDERVEDHTIPNPAEYGLTEEVIDVSKQVLQIYEKRQDTSRRLTDDRIPSILRVDAPSFRQDGSIELISKGTAAYDFSEADLLERIELLEAPIRKHDIPQNIYNAIAGIAIQNLGVVVSEGYQPRALWRGNSIARIADSIIDKYNGTVTAVSGTKLPVNDDFIGSYFTEEQATRIIPESIQRLQFDAEMAPTGTKPFVSRLSTVVYTSTLENGGRQVITTVRKADRIPAERAIQSLIDESRAVSFVAHTNRNYREIASGLPTLGK